MKRIVGLDLSLTRTGIAILSEAGYAEVRDITTRAAQLLPTRINTVLAEVTKVCAYPEPIVIIEEHLRAPRMSGKAYDRAELAGVIKQFLWNSAITFHMVHPKTLKKYVTGKGNEGDKDLILHLVAKKMGVETRNSDQADAAALADFGYHIFSDVPRRQLAQYEIDVLNKWRKEHL
jgi:Holliday junction resolvasome RuvABC endonuclease subunit